MKFRMVRSEVIQESGEKPELKLVQTLEVCYPGFEDPTGESPWELRFGLDLDSDRVPRIQVGSSRDPSRLD